MKILLHGGNNMKRFIGVIIIIATIAVISISTIIYALVNLPQPISVGMSGKQDDAIYLGSVFDDNSFKADEEVPLFVYYGQKYFGEDRNRNKDYYVGCDKASICVKINDDILLDKEERNFFGDTRTVKFDGNKITYPYNDIVNIDFSNYENQGYIYIILSCHTLNNIYLQKQITYSYHVLNGIVKINFEKIEKTI